MPGILSFLRSGGGNYTGDARSMQRAASAENTRNATRIANSAVNRGGVSAAAATSGASQAQAEQAARNAAASSQFYANLNAQERSRNASRGDRALGGFIQTGAAIGSSIGSMGAGGMGGGGAGSVLGGMLPQQPTSAAPQYPPQPAPPIGQPSAPPGDYPVPQQPPLYGQQDPNQLARLLGYG